MTSELLRRSPLFAGMTEEDLDELYHSARRITLVPGDVLMAEGELAGAAYLAIEGTFEITRRSGEREFVVDQRAAGELIGEMALLENARRSATVRASTSAKLLEITRETFQGLLSRSPSAALAVLQTIATRLRHSEVMLRHSEKMVALGTLSAGLAHELNNPAAAVQRSAAQLQDALARLQHCTAALADKGFSAPQAALVERLQAEIPSRLPAADSRSALAREDAEDALRDWLEGLGMDDGWEVAPPIATAGWSAHDLAVLTEGFSPAQQEALTRWLASAVIIQELLHEVNQGARRIGEIVAAVKSYAFLDRGTVQLLDVHEGIENTVAILRHRLEQGVDVVREYSSELPRIEAYGGELNQVWTNFLDNAIDAMNGRGSIRVRTYGTRDARGADAVAVEITDSGPGIPPAIQDRIFDAFFTTKQPGQGTGLGLHIAYNTVVNRHRGEIAVHSRPGETTFKVTLPVHLSED